MERERFEVRSGGATLVGDGWRPQSSNVEPVIVFLHAGVCDRRSWDQVVDTGHGGGENMTSRIVEATNRFARSP